LRMIGDLIFDSFAQNIQLHTHIAYQLQFKYGNDLTAFRNKFQINLLFSIQICTCNCVRQLPKTTWIKRPLDSVSSVIHIWNLFNL